MKLLEALLMLDIPFIVAYIKKTLCTAGARKEGLNIVLIQSTQSSYKIKIAEQANSDWLTRLTNMASIQLSQQPMSSMAPLVKELLVKHPLERQNILLASSRSSDSMIQVAASLYLEPNESPVFFQSILETLTDLIGGNPQLLKMLSPIDVCPMVAQKILQRCLSITKEQAELLYVSLGEVAMAPYEDKHSFGSILIHSSQNGKYEAHILLKKQVAFNDKRGVRKLLEVGKEKLMLLGTEQGIYGLGTSMKSYPNAAKVDFLTNKKWTLTHKGETFFQIHGGFPTIFRPKLSDSFLSQKIGAIFSYLDNQQKTALHQLLLSAVNQTNGTNILITEYPMKVVNRLSAQCTPIEPVRLTADLLNNISRIDGTVILDPFLTCFGIGAILDGQASQHGNPARGGRFNSAVMFCENSMYPCMILVVSQDGMVDIICSDHLDP